MNVCFVSVGKTTFSVKVRRNFRLSVSPGSAEALVRRGENIKYHFTTYFLSNISAKNYKNRLM